MKSIGILAVALVVAAATCAAAQTHQARPATHRAKLTQNIEVQGYPCAKGYAWFYVDGKLEDCVVSRQFAFGESMLPAGSFISLLPDGRPGYAVLQHDSEVAGVKCSGGNILLGPSEGSMTVFYPSGKLEQCWLAEDQSVQGVPCVRGGIMGLFGDGARRDGGAKFYESGKLKSCTLAKDYGTQHRGDHFEQKP